MPDIATPDPSDLPLQSAGHAQAAGSVATPARLGVFGGTFDPPHIGHVVAAVAVRHALRLDTVWLVVANEPWQKVGHQQVSPVADRLAMVRAAAAGVEGVEASTIEIDRGGSSYTADTLAQLRASDPDRELFVVVGSDAAVGLPTWKRAEEVRRGATMVVVDRPGERVQELPEGWAFERVEIPRLEVSSSDLRRRVADGRPIDGLVPPAVGSLIRDLGLYRGPCV